LADSQTRYWCETTQAVSLLPAREFATDKNSIEVFKENYQKTFDNVCSELTNT
jgi:transcription-repair coupling factor (superfamily II helicase)